MTIIKVLIFGCSLFYALAMHGQIPNRPVPENILPYHFALYDSTQQGYYLTSPFRIGSSNSIKSAMILDSQGYLVWYMPLFTRFVHDFKFNAARQQYQFVNFKNPQQVQYVLMDTGFNPVDTFTTINGVLADIHDFQISSNNTVLLAGITDSVMDLSGYLFNGQPGSATTIAKGFIVQEFDEDHNLLFQWNSNEHIHPGETYGGYGYNPAGFDYCHGNAIEEDTDGNLLLSFRNLNAVYKIHRQTGEVLWILGGPGSSFAFANDAGFSGQHDARRLLNGNIALFDNANMAAPPRISRAVEYKLDSLNGVATMVWEYQYSPAFFSTAMGNHQTTSDRNHLINYGISYRPDPSFVFADDNGNKIAELLFQDSFMSYRSYVFDLPLGDVERPVLSCSHNGGSIRLSAPAGYGAYAWSNGETSSSINLSETGTYQVWVNHGIGMLGSEPYFVQDLDGCPVSNISDPKMVEQHAIVAYYDLLGRSVAAPVQASTGRQILVVRYADGRLRLKHF